MLLVIPSQLEGIAHPCWFVSNNNGSPRGGEDASAGESSRLGAHGGMVQAYLRGLVDCIPPRASCSSIHRQSKEVVRGSIYSPSTSQIPVRVTHHHLPLPGGAATMMMHAMSFFPLPILPAYQNRILTGTSGVAGKTTLVYCVVVVPSVMISPCRARSVAVNHETSQPSDKDRHSTAQGALGVVFRRNRRLRGLWSCLSWLLLSSCW